MRTLWQSCVRWLLRLLPLLGATALPAADLEALRGTWKTPAGDVIEFRSRGSEWRAFLREAAPEGLGKFFAANSPVFFDLALRDGQLVCTLARAAAANQSVNLTARQADYTVIGGPLETAWDATSGRLVFEVQPTLERHFFSDENWVLRTEQLPDVLPSLVISLERVRAAPQLQLFLVRGEALEPATVFYHGVQYVAEFVTPNANLPLALNLTFAVGGQRVAVPAEAVSDGRERRYRSRPFVLRAADEGLPLPP